MGFAVVGGVGSRNTSRDPCVHRTFREPTGNSRSLWSHGGVGQGLQEGRAAAPVMVSLEIRFPSGRFHATPWDHHVNEGVAEWPISPWRILRALVAALYTRCPDVDRAVAARVLRKLSVPPHFTLPPATTAHTRHYLSLNELERTKTALT